MIRLLQIIASWIAISKGVFIMITKKIYAVVRGAAALSTLSLSLLHSHRALAEDAAPPGTTTAPGEGEIMVTARRKDEKLLEVPLNVTALTDIALKTLGVQTFSELMNVVPSLNTASNDRGDSVKLTMRGLGVSTTGGAKASVFLDGVYIGGNYSGIPLYGLGTIEVLKGPQSALFGRSTFAGAMNYVTRTPSNALEGAMNLELATLGEKRADGYLAGSIVPDKLRFVVSGTYDDFRAPDSWVNPKNGIRNGAQKGGGAMGKLVFTPTDQLTFTGVVSYSHIDDAPLAAIFIPTSARDGTFNKINPVTGATTSAVGNYPTSIRSITPKRGDFDATYQYLDHPGYKADVVTSYLRGQWQSDSGYSVSLTGGYGHETARSDLNVNLHDRAPAGGGYLYSLRTLLKEEDKSLELRVSSPEDRRIRLSAGVYYLNLRKAYDPNQSDSYLLAPVVGTYDLIIPHYYANTHTLDRSVFGAAYIDITHQLTLSLEGRYQSEKVHTVAADSVTKLISSYDPNAPYTLSNRTFQATFNAFLPRVNFQYKFNNNLNIYATYSEGTTPGGFNTSIYTPPEYRTIKEENLKNYEIGFKGHITRKLTIEAAAYHMDWLNQQTTGTFYINGINVALTTNQGNSRINGLEGLITWTTPLAGLSLRGAGSYNHSTYNKFCSVNYAALTYDYTGLTAAQKAKYACRNVDGNQLEGVSPLQGTLSFDYNFPIGDRLNGYFRGDYDYFGPMWDSEFNLAKTASAEVVNLRAGIASDRWTLEIYGKNITDENSPVRVQRASDVYAGPDNTTNQSVTLVLRRPRQVGVRLGYKF